MPVGEVKPIQEWSDHLATSTGGGPEAGLAEPV